MSNVFLYKVINSDDRDCCAYIRNQPMRFECGHYFGGVILQGSCYCGGEFAPYEEIKTVLTEDEYEALISFNKEIKKNGCGVTVGDERYKKGIELCEGIQYVYDKLNSEENQKIFEEVQEEEIRYLMEEYRLSDEDVEKIFNEYALMYRDRSIVGSIYEDYNDLGYEEAWELGYIKENDLISTRYFDTEKFGEDLVNEDNRYLELDDGRIVSLNY